MIYLLDMNSDGRPRGIAHIDFANQESAVATVNSATQEPIHLAGRDLRIDFAAGARERQQVVVEPGEKLYFSGLAGEESEIRTVFQQFGDDIVDIHLCMLFTLSHSVPTHSHGVTINSEKSPDRRTQPSWFP